MAWLFRGTIQLFLLGFVESPAGLPTRAHDPNFFCWVFLEGCTRIELGLVVRLSWGGHQLALAPASWRNWRD